jgi:hypothetical protein
VAAASILTMAFMAMVIVMLGVFEDTRVALYVGGTWLVLLFVAYKLWVRGGGLRRAELVDETAAIPVVKAGGLLLLKALSQLLRRVDLCPGNGGALDS